LWEAGYKNTGPWTGGEAWTGTKKFKGKGGGKADGHS